MARAARLYRPIEQFSPIAEINTTPLVDVMLVLLIMFILIIPVTSHKLPVDLPQPGRTTPAPVHRLDLDAAGRLFWDGREVGAREFAARLAVLATDPAQPVLHMNADGETRYERFDEILAAVRRAGITRLGFVGMQRFAPAIAGR
jgi:biopolymer transport protein ExbD